MDFSFALKCVKAAILLNILLPLILTPFATPGERKPPNGAQNLSLKGQFMHMMVHHNQVIFMSSAIVGLIVFLAVIIAERS